MELLQNDVAADVFSVLSRLAVSHKVTVVTTDLIRETGTDITAPTYRVFVVDDDAAGVVSMTPDVYREFELRTFEGDESATRVSSRYELRALQCRTTEGRPGPVYSVK